MTNHDERAPHLYGLDFHPSTEPPTEPGDYVLYNQCDGYHVAELIHDEGWAGVVLQEWGGQVFSPDSYQAWAKLPDTEELYARFAGNV